MNQPITIRDTSVTIIDVLKLLSEGYVYEQILAKYPELSLADILACIQVATDLLEEWVTTDGSIKIDSTLKIIARNSRLINLDKIREASPRAYEKWETAEDNRLASLFKDGRKVAEIASMLGRQEGAVMVRLKRLGLTE